MSEKYEKRDVPAATTKTERHETVELERKLMNVDDGHKYTIDCRQNGESRFVRIIEIGTQRRSRIVVPMCVSGMFLDHLAAVDKFVLTYVPKTKPQASSNAGKAKLEFAHSSQYVTDGGRRYYFDVIDNGSGSLLLRMSYVFTERDTVYIYVDGIKGLREIIEGYQKKYPSISPSDDYSAKPIRRGYSRNNFNGGSRDGYSTRGRYRRPFASGLGRPSYNGTSDATTPSEGAGSKRISSLKVLSDPSPLTVTHQAKKFVIEIVEGTNTFARITEIINDARKSTIHIPLEVVSQFRSSLEEMEKKYAAKKSS